MSSMSLTSNCRQTPTMPPDSTWNTRDGFAAVERSKVAWSSSGIVSMSKSGVCWRISTTASVMTVSVFSPRKSIFSMPSRSAAPSRTGVTIEPSLARVSGMYSERSRSLMTTPAACTPVPRVSPSSFDAYSHSCAVAGSSSTAFFSSGFLSIAPGDVLDLAGLLVLLVDARERDAEFVRDHLRDAVGVAVAPAQHAAPRRARRTSRPACRR